MFDGMKSQVVKKANENQHLLLEFWCFSDEL